MPPVSVTQHRLTLLPSAAISQALIESGAEGPARSLGTRARRGQCRRSPEPAAVSSTDRLMSSPRVRQLRGASQGQKCKTKPCSPSVQLSYDKDSRLFGGTRSPAREKTTGAIVITAQSLTGGEPQHSTALKAGEQVEVGLRRDRQVERQVLLIAAEKNLFPTLPEANGEAAQVPTGAGATRGEQVGF